MLQFLWILILSDSTIITITWGLQIIIHKLNLQAKYQPKTVRIFYCIITTHLMLYHM